jgi:hypothetical protein
MGQPDGLRKKRLLTLTYVALITCGLGIAILFLGKGLWKQAQKMGASWTVANQLKELDTVRAKWEARTFTRYRLVIETTSLRDCREDVEVKDEVVTTIFENSCGATRTITDLFNYVESTITSRECGPNGCECDGVISVEAAYHPQLGYPLSMHTYLKKDWTTAPYPLGPFGCLLIGRSLPDDTITLTPLK